METPFLDQLIEDHQNHIESVEATSYDGIPVTRKQLAELETIKAIVVARFCKTFYCRDESYHKIDKCKNECDNCKSMKLKYSQ